MSTGCSVSTRRSPAHVTESIFDEGAPRERPARPGVSVVIPVFNSEATIEQVVHELDRILDRCASRHEILLVDDASQDQSWQLLEKLASGSDRVRAIRLERNFGEHNAVLCGIRAARLDVVVTMDDDLQQPPSEIPLLLDALGPGVDLVYGVPSQDAHGPVRRLATRAAKPVLEHVFKVPRATSLSSFRAVRSSLCGTALGSPGPLFSLDNLFSSATGNIVAIRVRHDPRRAGSSQYTLAKLHMHTMNSIAGASPAPLLFASAAGAVLVAGSSIGAVVAIATAVTGGGVPWAIWGASAAGATAGLVLISMGMLGEYAARILLEVSGQPAYAVEQRIGFDDDH